MLTTLPETCGGTISTDPTTFEVPGAPVAGLDAAPEQDLVPDSQGRARDGLAAFAVAGRGVRRDGHLGSELGLDGDRRRADAGHRAATGEPESAEPAPEGTEAAERRAQRSEFRQGWDRWRHRGLRGGRRRAERLSRRLRRNRRGSRPRRRSRSCPRPGRTRSPRRSPARDATARRRRRRPASSGSAPPAGTPGASSWSMSLICKLPLSHRGEGVGRP